MAGGQALAILGLHDAFEGRWPHLERSRADRHVAECESLRAGRVPLAGRETDRRAATGKLAETQFLRPLQQR